jgi:hypothetical protein
MSFCSSKYVEQWTNRTSHIPIYLIISGVLCVDGSNKVQIEMRIFVTTSTTSFKIYSTFTILFTNTKMFTLQYSTFT